MRVVVAVERDKSGRWRRFAEELRETTGYSIDFICPDKKRPGLGIDVLEEAFGTRADVVIFVPYRPVKKMILSCPSIFGVWLESSLFVGEWLPEGAVVVAPSRDVLDAAESVGCGKTLLWAAPVSDAAQKTRRTNPKDEVVVLGSWSPVREAILQEVLERGVKARGVGGGWRRSRLRPSSLRPTTKYEELLKAAANAAVTIHTPCLGLDPLLVDLLYIGCCVVCEWREELELVKDAVCAGGNPVEKAVELVGFELGRRPYEDAARQVHKKFAPGRLVQALLEA